MSVWRVGHVAAPCDFPPRHLYGWSNRFDDPNREYRTLYSADEKKTCLREVLADFRPNSEAIKEFRKLFGPVAEDERLFGTVPMEWRDKNALAEAEIEMESGGRVDVENTTVRRRLETELAAFLKEEHIRRIDTKELRSKKRHITQKISRVLFDAGHAVIKFRSHLDSLPCYALFEYRARLAQTGDAIPLNEDVRELREVCNEFKLRLEPHPRTK